MDLSHGVNKTRVFIESAEELKISDAVLVSIERSLGGMSLSPTKNFRRIFIAENNVFQIWNAKLPDPDYRKGTRGGFRLICYFVPAEQSVYLDWITRRSELGGKREDKKQQKRYDEYIEQLRERLMKSYC